ncbi:helix-turn-helix domain-containing protein [Bacillus sp. ISL-46]|nr:helix-turn-helix domain-containing protein [Bacillus sp. ISL-46]
MLSILSAFFDNFIPDWHTQTENIPYNVLILVVQGRVQYTISGKQITAEKGDILYIPSTTVRAGKNHESGPHQKYTAIFTLNENEIPTNPFPIDQNFFHLKTRSFEYVKNRFERLYFDIRGKKKHRDFICLGILQELIGLFAQELEVPSIAPIKVKYAQIIERFLLENYRKSIEIEQLAKLIHRSPGYTISVFKEVVGHSPIKYIHQLRILEACNLLVNTDMTVVAISEYLGYYDTSYFSRMFKKLTSLSPMEYIRVGHQLEHQP